MSVSPEFSLGKVIADLDSKAYTEDGGNRFPKGQCTWYCAGRAMEKKGVNLAELLPVPANGGDWYAKVQYNPRVCKRSAADSPITDCIASFAHGSCGHVVYVEAQRGDYTYFTEWNWNQSMNGKLQKVLTKDFCHLHGCVANGYIEVR